MTAGGAQLKPPSKQEIKHGAGDHAGLAELGNRARQTPTGHTHSHAALNDRPQQHRI